MDFTAHMLGHLLLGKNIFKGTTAEESRSRVMTMAVPDFRKLDKRIDERLNKIIQRALARDLKQRKTLMCKRRRPREAPACSNALPA